MKDLTVDLQKNILFQQTNFFNRKEMRDVTFLLSLKMLLSEA